MVIRFALLVLGIVMSLGSQAADLTPRISNQGLGLSLSALTFPESLEKDLKSGFENRVLLRAVLLASTKIVARRDVVVTVKFDLWDELFTVRTFVGTDKISELTLKETKGVIAYLSGLQLENVFPTSAFQTEKDLVLQAEISLNPIEREKIERVRKWVASNSAPGGAVGVKAGGSPLTAKPNDLFNAIFDQYIRGEDIVAPWKVTLTSNAFIWQPQVNSISK
jgi:hypothetical protein